MRHFSSQHYGSIWPRAITLKLFSISGCTLIGLLQSVEHSHGEHLSSKSFTDIKSLILPLLIVFLWSLTYAGGQDSKILAWVQCHYPCWTAPFSTFWLSALPLGTGHKVQEKCFDVFPYTVLLLWCWRWLKGIYLKRHYKNSKWFGSFWTATNK